MLWTLLVKQCATPEDQAVFYKFLKELTSIGQLTTHVSSIEDISEFFTVTLCNEQNSFQHLTLEGMEAIELLLIGVNRATDKIAGNPGRKLAPMIGPQLPQSMDSGNDEAEFKVLVSPTELKGVSVLWKIMLEARNETVSMRAIELLNKLYTKLGEKLEGAIADISTKFIETAVEKLRIFYDRTINQGENRGREIVKLLKLIDEMLDESERKGNGGIIPMQALIKGTSMKVLFLNQATTDSPGGGLDRVEIQLHSRITLWQVKMLLSDIFHILPEMVHVV